MKSTVIIVFGFFVLIAVGLVIAIVALVVGALGKKKTKADDNKGKDG